MRWCRNTRPIKNRENSREILLVRRNGLALLLQHRRRRLDLVQARAILPQDLAALIVAQRQAEELLERLGECAVGMWIVSRADKVFRSDLPDHFDRRLLVDIKSDVTLALEVLARHHRKLLLASRADLFPMVVKAPGPPADPSPSAFEESAGQLR